MNKQQILLASLSLNAVALLAAGYYLMAPGDAGEAPRERAAKSASGVPVIGEGEVSAGNPGASVTAVDTGGFRWQMIESEDYRQYIANLRGIGCPEETIRDIIIADVEKLFASRIAAVRSQNRRNYWDTGRNLSRYAAEFDAEARKRLTELEEQKRKMIRDLLGIDVATEKEALAGQSSEDRYGLAGFLPEDKQAAVREVLEQFENKRRESSQRIVQAVTSQNPELGNMVAGITSMLGEGRNNPLDFLMNGGSAMWDRGMESERRAELEKILTPEELFEFDLRNSSTAERMRWELSGFSPNESEFREIFRVRQETEQKLASAPREQHEQIRAARDEQLQAIMDAGRFAEYNNSRDPAWSAAAQVAADAGMPRSTANEVVAIKADAESKAAAIRSDANLSAEQRQESLQALSRETESKIAQQLGDDGLEQYKRRGGGPWLRMLERPQQGGGRQGGGRFGGFGGLLGR